MVMVTSVKTIARDSMSRPRSTNKGSRCKIPNMRRASRSPSSGPKAMMGDMSVARAVATRPLEAICPPLDALDWAVMWWYQIDEELFTVGF